MLDKVVFLTLAAFSFGSLGQIFRNLGINLYLFDIVIFSANLYFLLFLIKKQKFYLNSHFILFSFFSIFLLIVGLFNFSDFLMLEKLTALGFWLRINLYFSFGYFVFNLIKFNFLSFDSLKRIFTYNFYLILILNFVQYFFMLDISFMESYGFDPHTSRLVGFFLDPNFMGFYLVLYLFLNEFWLKNKLISYLALGMIFLTSSRSAFLVLIILLGYLLFFKTKKALLLISLTLLFFAFSSLPERFEGFKASNDSSSLRIESYKNASYIYLFEPIFGIGIGNYRNYLIGFNLISPEFYISNSNNYSDSSLLSVLVFSGFFGFLIFLIFLASFVKTRINFMLLSLVLVNSLMINSLFFPPLMVLIFLILNLDLKEI